VGGGGIFTGENISRVLTTTALAGAAGAVSSLVFCWIMFKKPDVSMTLNGMLAGLVAITAPCAVVSPGASVVIGIIAGVLVVLAVEFIDKTLKVDDPVGASSVHLVNGVFGTLAVGIWANAPSDGIVGLLHGGGFRQLGIQALGSVTVLAWAGVTSALLYLIIKKTIGMRVSKKEELDGLDMAEHESDAYAGFQIFSNT
jgi:Amt family ammonium transporter